MPAAPRGMYLCGAGKFSSEFQEQAGVRNFDSRDVPVWSRFEDNRFAPRCDDNRFSLGRTQCDFAGMKKAKHSHSDLLCERAGTAEKEQQAAQQRSSPHAATPACASACGPR